MDMQVTIKDVNTNPKLLLSMEKPFVESQHKTGALAHIP
jgi:hypothetical protein